MDKIRIKSNALILLPLKMQLRDTKINKSAPSEIILTCKKNLSTLFLMIYDHNKDFVSPGIWIL